MELWRLILAGKSSAEIEFAQSLTRLNHTATALKLPQEKENGPFSIIVLTKEEDETTTATFDFDKYMSMLNTRSFGRLLIWSPRLPSTHDIVSQNFGELPLGSVCVADVQYKGRGWKSDSPRTVFRVACCHRGHRGCLLYSCIGLNLENERPMMCLNSALQEISNGACQFTREELTAAFFNKFESFFHLFTNQGFQPLESWYDSTWLHSGWKVIIPGTIEDQLLENVITIQGITPSGYLLAVGEDNGMYKLHPDGNSLDFFQGLIRRKIAVIKKNPPFVSKRCSLADLTSGVNSL